MIVINNIILFNFLRDKLQIPGRNNQEESQVEVQLGVGEDRLAEDKMEEHKVVEYKMVEHKMVEHKLGKHK